MDQTGVAKALAAGTATITATVAGGAAFKNVEVSAIQIGPRNPSFEATTGCPPAIATIGRLCPAEWNVSDAWLDNARTPGMPSDGVHYLTGDRGPIYEDNVDFGPATTMTFQYATDPGVCTNGVSLSLQFQSNGVVTTLWSAEPRCSKLPATTVRVAIPSNLGTGRLSIVPQQHDGVGTSVPFNIDNFRVQIDSGTGLSPPANMTATPGEKEVVLSWAAAPRATSYNIYQASTTGGPYTRVGNTPNTGFTVTGLSSEGGPTYYFVVTSSNGSTESIYSTEVSSVAYLTKDYVIYNANPPPWSGVAVDGAGNVWIGTDSACASCGNGLTEVGADGSPITEVGTTYPPEGLAIDGAGNFWVASGGFMKIDGTTKAETDYLASSREVAVGPKGFIWTILDDVNVGLKKIDPTINPSTGGPVATYHVAGYALAVDAAGDAWITTGNGVTEVDSTGTTKGPFPTGGSGSYGIAIGPAGHIWVANAGSVGELNPDGSLMGTYPAQDGAGHGLAIDSSGDVFVLDGTNTIQSQLVELSPSGSTIRSYFIGLSPTSLAIDRSGNVWIPGGGVSRLRGDLTELVGIAHGPQYFPVSGPQFAGGGNY